MPRDPNGSKADAPLWLIAVSMLMIAFCLVVLVFRSFLGRHAPAETVLAEPGAAAALDVQPPARHLPQVGSGKRPPGRAASPLSRSGLPETAQAGGEAQRTAPVPTTTTGGLVPGGYGPVSSLGQTNYRTAIVGRVRLRGTPPAEQPVDAAADAYCATVLPQPLLSRFYALGTNGALADVLVWVREGLPKDQPPRPTAPAHMQFANCQLAPYMSAVTSRQSVAVENKDAIPHVLRVSPHQGRESLAQVSPHATGSVIIRSPPELFIPCRCQFHPWETAYVSMLPHSFFSVTDADGRFSITNIPPGTYVLEALHQKSTGTNGLTRRLTIAAGETVDSDFELELPAPHSPAQENSQAHNTP